QELLGGVTTEQYGHLGELPTGGERRPGNPVHLLAVAFLLLLRGSEIVLGFLDSVIGLVKVVLSVLEVLFGPQVLLVEFLGLVREFLILLQRIGLAGRLLEGGGGGSDC